jgi:hypothetical protein
MAHGDGPVFLAASSASWRARIFAWTRARACSRVSWRRSGFGGSAEIRQRGRDEGLQIDRRHQLLPF